MEQSLNSNYRLYRDLARFFSSELAAGKYSAGARLSAERKLALEVQGIVEARVGSGAYLLRIKRDRYSRATA